MLLWFERGDKDLDQHNVKKAEGGKMKENTNCNNICTVFIWKNNHLNAFP